VTFHDLVKTELELKDGIWYSGQLSSVSFPEDGYDFCFEIEENSFWFKHRNNCIVEALNICKTSGPIFDIGGGNGFVSMAMEKAGFETILVEPGLSGISNAKQRGLRYLICSTFEDAGFKADFLSNIGLFDVVEHVDSDQEFLQNVFNCLRPGGKIIITVPAYQFLWSKEDIEAGHFRRYSINSIQKKLKAVGFKIKYKTYFFSFLPIPIFLFRTLPGKLGLNKKSNDISKHKKEHENSGILSKILNIFLNWELSLIKNKKRILFGGSCLIVGEK